MVRILWGFFQMELYMVIPPKLFILSNFKSVVSVMFLNLFFFSILKEHSHLHPVAAHFILSHSHSRGPLERTTQKERGELLVVVKVMTNPLATILAAGCV